MIKTLQSTKEYQESWERFDDIRFNEGGDLRQNEAIVKAALVDEEAFLLNDIVIQISYSRETLVMQVERE